MNSLVRNKKKAKKAAVANGHRMGRYWDGFGTLVCRCKDCGAVAYARGKVTRMPLYWKSVSGSAVWETCGDIKTQMAELGIRVA